MPTYCTGLKRCTLVPYQRTPACRRHAHRAVYVYVRMQLQLGAVAQYMAPAQWPTPKHSLDVWGARTASRCGAARVTGNSNTSTAWLCISQHLGVCERGCESFRSTPYPGSAAIRQLADAPISGDCFATSLEQLQTQSGNWSRQRAAVLPSSADRTPKVTKPVSGQGKSARVPSSPGAYKISRRLYEHTAVGTHCMPKA